MTATAVKTIDRVVLPCMSLGTERTLVVHRFGLPEARPKVYVQAGIHADELPAPLAAHHLLVRLGEAAARGEIRGEITVVPLANPIGTAQVVMHDHLGRFEQATGRNFNREWPDVSVEVAKAVAGRLGGDAAENQRTVTAAIRAALAARAWKSEADALQLELMKLAAGADIALDLHTDSEAEFHLYLDPEHWPAAQDLAVLLGARVVMLSRAAGGNPFEETLTAPWLAARAAAPAGTPLPLPLTVTVELRGEAQAFDELAAADAMNLVRFLQRRGVIAGDPGPAPAFEGIAATFEATEIVRSPAAGIVAHKLPLGAMVQQGQVIAEIVDVTSDDPKAARIPVRAGTSGLLFTREYHKLARPGQPIAKIHGTVPVRDRAAGKLLSD